MWCDAAAAIEEQTVRRLYWTKEFWEKESVWQISPVCAAQKVNPGE